MPDPLHAGVTLFNAGRFFEAHEVWEDAWRDAQGDDRAALQVLIQLAVCLEHRRRGNDLGVTRMLDRARRRLALAPPQWRGFDLPAITDAVEAACTHGEPAPLL